MTTTSTADVSSSVAQTLRLVSAGADLVRLTTQGVKEAAALGPIRRALDEACCHTPLVADVHFNPAAALEAAQWAQAVRINPGNFLAAQHDNDAERRERLRPLVQLCQQRGVALRLGVNHGSLSQRIVQQYGDTPPGIVASCLEYLEALEDLGFRQTVISVKSSNTRVMVNSVRLLSRELRRRGTPYPLHLGVTEAGSDEEGRVKSAAGIGALLLDGLGDTLRVSLTEEPERELPVCQEVAQHIARLAQAPDLTLDPDRLLSVYSPYEYRRRPTNALGALGGDNAPDALDSCHGMTPITLAQLLATPDDIARIDPAKPLVARATTLNPAAELRALALTLQASGINNPLVVSYDRPGAVATAIDLAPLLLDGLIDGLCLQNPQRTTAQNHSDALLLLQATRARFSHTEFISCPGCGRTLYDIQDATRQIKEQLPDLPGVKIAVMGCIVNGLGEMADADYAYVGAGRQRISIYRRHQRVAHNIPQQDALATLQQLVENDKKERN